MSAKRVYFDAMRTILFSATSETYAAIGATLTVRPRIITITNNTNGNMIFSDDSGVAAGKIFVPASSFRLLDLTANLVPEKDDSFVIAEGTIIYVKRESGSVPTSGSIYLEYVYGNI